MVAEKSTGIDDLKVCLECNRQFTGIVSACPHDGSPLVKVMQDPLIGTTLAGKYEIISVIGHGGMGVVYKAKDTLIERLVAIKMLKAQLISDSMSVKRFHHEGRAASRINHPHVITVHEFNISPSGQPFIVMDFLEGTSLAQVIKDDGHVGVERTVKILIEACDALNHAHRHGVVHRDLKPSNIVLIDYDGPKDFVKVVDFGVAKLITEGGQELQRLTQAGEVCGSPVYMSPEQCQGEELDARSDIYSIGVVMYESLTGLLPLIGQTMVETMSKHITENAAPFSQARPDLYIPERLEAVVFKALSKNPAERHETMALLKQDLDMAIPKPGRSQVLRSVPEEANARTSGSIGQEGKASTVIFQNGGGRNATHHLRCTLPQVGIGYELDIPQRCNSLKNRDCKNTSGNSRLTGIAKAISGGANSGNVPSDSHSKFINSFSFCQRTPATRTGQRHRHSARIDRTKTRSHNQPTQAVTAKSGRSREHAHSLSPQEAKFRSSCP